MARAFVCLALLAVGCGGALAGDPDGGAGAGGTGTAGTTGSGGAAVGGTTGGTGVGATGGSPYDGVYDWGDVTVQVSPVSSPPTVFYLDVRDPADQDVIVSFTKFPVATKFSPNDGAFSRVLYGCSRNAIESVDVYSCVDAGSATAAPGCLVATFRSTGVTGAFIQPDGSPCVISGGQGNISLPSPAFTPSTELPLASIGAVLQCATSDGIQRRLAVTSVIPLEARVLLCAAGD